MTKSPPELFYKYMTGGTARIVLERHTLRWSTPALFNDPYDTQFDLHVEGDRDEVRQRSLEKLWNAWYGDGPYKPHPNNLQGQLIKKYRAVFPKMSREEFEAEMGQSIDEGFENAMRALPALQAEFRSEMSNSKILCQSIVPDSLLMWSYYADHHRGAVLCFKADPGLNSPWLVAQAVTYSRSMPRIGDVEFFSDLSAGLVALDAKTLVDQVIFTKAAEWAHEGEWRLQAGSGRHKEAAFEDVPFHRSELDAVIFGCVMSPGDRAALKEIVRNQYPHARILAARKHDREFRLVIETVES